MTLTDFTIDAVEGLRSYATLAEAKRYLVVNLLRWPAWMALADADQQRLLVAATARLDLLNFVGRKADKAQATQWPRVDTGLEDVDNNIPDALVHAVAIMAGSLATDPTAGEEPGTVANEKRLKADVAEIEFFRPADSEALQDRTAYRLLQNAGLLGAAASGARGYVSRRPFRKGACGASPGQSAADVIPTEPWAWKGNSEAIPAAKLTNAAGGAGIDRAAVDARIADQVEFWARDANSAIPANKLGNVPPAVVNADIDARIADWAENENDDPIPAGKLSNAPLTSVAEIDARIADWAETENAEAIPAAKLTNAPQIEDEEIDARIVSWAREGNNDIIPDAKIGDGLDDRIESWARAGSTEEIPADRLNNAPIRDVISDATLTGDGVHGSELSVALPLPEGGEQGQFLSRTEGGYDWTNAPQGGGTLLGEGEQIYRVFTYALLDTAVVLQDDVLYRLTIRYEENDDEETFPVFFRGRDLYQLLDSDPRVQDDNGPGLVHVPEASRFAVSEGGRTWQFCRAQGGQLAWAWPDAPRQTSGPFTGTFVDPTAVTILEQLSGFTRQGGTGRGLPSGGTVGQFLERTADGYVWADAPSGGGGGVLMHLGTSEFDFPNTFEPNSRRPRASVPVGLALDPDTVADNDLLMFYVESLNTSTTLSQNPTGGTSNSRGGRLIRGTDFKRIVPVTGEAGRFDYNNGCITIGFRNAASEETQIARHAVGNQLRIWSDASGRGGRARFSAYKITEGGTAGGGTGTLAGVSDWAQADNNDKIPSEKLPAIPTLKLGTDLPAPSNSEYVNLYGIGTERDNQIETDRLSFLKHRDPNTALLFVGRIAPTAYGYSSEDAALGGAISPEGVGPEIIRSLFVEGEDEEFNIFADVVVTSATPFSNEPAFRFQWRTLGDTSWNTVVLQREPDQESNAERVVYKSADLNANPWQVDTTLEIEFRSQTGTNVGINLFTTDAFVDLIDRDELELETAKIRSTIADNEADTDARIARIESPARTLLGTWERSAAGVTGSTQALASAIQADPESFVTYRVQDVGNIVQKRASESVFTAAGTNLVNASELLQDTHAPSTGDNNRFKWRLEQFDFNIYLLRLTDLDDNVLQEELTPVPFKPNLLNEDYQPFENVFVSHQRDSLTATFGALVENNGQRLRVWGLKL